MNRIILLAISSLLVTTSVSAGGPPTAPPPRAIPGITATDTHPQACVSCHVDMPEIGIDARLTSVLRRLSDGVDPKLLAKVQKAMDGGHLPAGKHPDVADSLESIPGTCIACHEATESAPKFSRLMHEVHLTGGEENHFLTVFQGECTLCHKLQESGEWVVPSGSEK